MLFRLSLDADQDLLASWRRLRLWEAGSQHNTPRNVAAKHWRLPSHSLEGLRNVVVKRGHSEHTVLVGRAPKQAVNDVMGKDAVA